MPVLVSSPSCDTVLRHLAECTGRGETAPAWTGNGSILGRGGRRYRYGSIRRRRPQTLPKIHKSAGHVQAAMSFGSPYILAAHHSHTPWAPPDLHQRTSEPTGSISCRHAFHIPHVFRPPCIRATSISGRRPCAPAVPTRSHTPMRIFPYVRAVPTHLRRLPHLSIPWRNSPYKCQIPHRASKLHKIPHRTRRDQRSVHSNLRIQPAYADSLQQRGSSGNAQGAVPLGMGTTTVPSQLPPAGTSAHWRQPAETSDRFTQIPCDGGPCVSVTTASTSWGATACYGRA